MPIVQDTGVIQQRAEVASWNIFLALSVPEGVEQTKETYHGEIDTLVILERVEQPNQPFALCCSQDITLGQDMANLVQLEQQLFAHHLQSTHFFGVLFLSQVYLPIASLADLCEDLEITLPQSCPSLAEIGTLAAEVLCKGIVVLCIWCCRGRWVLRLELRKTVLSCVYVGEQVIVVIEEICASMSAVINAVHCTTYTVE